jgi:hypothetical protein
MFHYSTLLSYSITIEIYTSDGALLLEKEIAGVDPPFISGGAKEIRKQISKSLKDKINTLFSAQDVRKALTLL